MKIQNDSVVKIAYRITDNDGRVMDEMTPAQGYEYMQGRGQIVGPVERALEGKTAGYRADVAVTPRDAYGDYDPNLVAELPRSRFPANLEITVGMKFNTQSVSGQMVTVRVVDLDPKNVTVDGNHPLAGLDLNFEVRVLGVREASASEVETGRVAKPTTELH